MPRKPMWCITKKEIELRKKLEKRVANLENKTLEEGV